MSTIFDRMRQSFPDKDYRHTYANGLVDSKLATQLKVLREQRGWTQAQLAEKCGMQQARISVLEDVNYSSWSISTLRRIGKAFDLWLDVEWKEFGEVPRTLHDMNRETLERESFDDDPIFHEQVAASSEVQTSTNAVIESPTSKLIYTVGLGAQTQINSEEINPLTIPGIGEQLKLRFPQEGITSLPFIPPWPRVRISPITGLKTRGKPDDERSVA
jgi:transcriptional regulator with XRE-family HTH domain